MEKIDAGATARFPSKLSLETKGQEGVMGVVITMKNKHCLKSSIYFVTLVYIKKK